MRSIGLKHMTKTPNKSTTLNSQLLCPCCLPHMHWITWELLFGTACTPGTPGTATRARTMKPHHRTASALPLRRHALCKSWWVALSIPRAKTSEVGSVHRQSHTGDRESRHTGYMVGLMHQRNINAPGGLVMSVTPSRGSTSGMQPSGRFTPMGYTEKAEITQQHRGTNTTINPAEDNCEKQCGDNEAKPHAITMNPRKRHNKPTQANPCRVKWVNTHMAHV